MPGCSLSFIKEKLQTFPVKKTLISLGSNALGGAALGSATGALGAHPAGLDAGTTALNGAVGGAALNAFLGLISSTYYHFAGSEQKQEQNPQEQPKKNWRESVSKFYSRQFSKKNVHEAEQKPLQEPIESKPISHSAIVKTALLLTAAGFSDSILSNMLGDAIFQMPYTIGDTAKEAAIGSSILTGMIAFIAVSAACAPRLASGLVDCCDKTTEIICCDGKDDIERQQGKLSERVRAQIGR